MMLARRKMIDLISLAMQTTAMKNQQILDCLMASKTTMVNSHYFKSQKETLKILK
jgi:hypothetical protein